MKKALSVLLSLILAIGMFGGISSTAYAKDAITVKYEQTEARKMLNRINQFRTAGSWCWNESNTKR